MAAIEAFGRRFEFKVGRSVAPRRRGYDAAKIDRLTGGWPTETTDANKMLRRGLRVIRARSRNEAINNDYLKKFLKLCEKNVVGASGIRLKIVPVDGPGDQRPGTIDTGAQAILQDGWSEWGKVGSCTMDGRLSWCDSQKLAIKSVARDGELLIRHVTGRDVPNPFNYAFQLLEPDQLDEDFTAILPNGNFVFMGIEHNRWGRPVAYHILTQHPGADPAFFRTRQRERVPASEITHLFVSDRANQFRGVPWAHTALTRLHHLGQYEEAELIASRAGASKMMVYETDVEAAGDLFEEEGAFEDALDALPDEMDPGTSEVLPPGVSARLLDPSHPGTQFPFFVKAMLRGISSGLDVSYNALANDLEGVNFSSLRQGNLDERDGWRVLQIWLIEHMHTAIWERFLAGALLSPEINLPARRFDKFNSPKWRPRGWPWVDPQKEAKGNSDQVAMATKSRQQIAAEQGRDFEDVLDDLVEEKAMAEQKGITLSGAAPNEPVEAELVDDD